MLGCRWLGTAVSGASSVEGQGQRSPPNDGGGSQHPAPPYTTMSSTLSEGTVANAMACLLAGGCASAAQGFS